MRCSTCSVFSAALCARCESSGSADLTLSATFLAFSSSPMRAANESALLELLEERIEPFDVELTGPSAASCLACDSESGEMTLWREMESWSWSSERKGGDMTFSSTVMVVEEGSAWAEPELPEGTEVRLNQPNPLKPLPAPSSAEG